MSAFLLLEESQKREALLIKGTLIGKRPANNSFVFLYQLDGFYVEVYCKLHEGQVTEYRAFENISELHPYLEKISLENLL